MLSVSKHELVEELGVNGERIIAPGSLHPLYKSAAGGLDKNIPRPVAEYFYLANPLH